MADSTSYIHWRPHPWHGLEVGKNPPKLVQAYIEITPFDIAKLELDKVTGYLRLDRLQRTSSIPPTLYGIIPRTYCGRRVAAFSPGARSGDQDPLDICVISSSLINHNDILLDAVVIGGIQVVDNQEADDKIVAVLEGDDVMGHLRDISELPAATTDRLRHYFQTYKMYSDQENAIQIHQVYGHEQALRVVQAAIEDYQEMNPNAKEEQGA